MNTDNASKEDPGVEEVLEEIVDLEDYAKRGERPPLSKGYRIRVNGEAFVLHDPTPTGREILTLLGSSRRRTTRCGKSSPVSGRAGSSSTGKSIYGARASRSSRRCRATRRTLGGSCETQAAQLLELKQREKANRAIRLRIKKRASARIAG